MFFSLNLLQWPQNYGAISLQFIWTTPRSSYRGRLCPSHEAAGSWRPPPGCAGRCCRGVWTAGPAPRPPGLCWGRAWRCPLARGCGWGTRGARPGRDWRPRGRSISRSRAEATSPCQTGYWMSRAPLRRRRMSCWPECRGWAACRSRSWASAWATPGPGPPGRGWPHSASRPPWSAPSPGPSAWSSPGRRHSWSRSGEPALMSPRCWPGRRGAGDCGACTPWPRRTAEAGGWVTASPCWSSGQRPGWWSAASPASGAGAGAAGEEHMKDLSSPPQALVAQRSDKAWSAELACCCYSLAHFVRFRYFPHFLPLPAVLWPFTFICQNFSYCWVNF